MAETLFIHGYATKLHASIFLRPLPLHEGFFALSDKIRKGDVDIFRWGVSASFSFLQSILPQTYIHHYRQEEILTENTELQEELFITIGSSKTKHIICHSMGCRLLLQTINKFGLPKCVQSIVFLQADIDHDEIITHPETFRRMRDSNLYIQNFHCFWDPSLITSLILHKKSRIGLHPWSQQGVTNHFSPLLRPINLHTSQLRSRRFANSLIRSL